MLLANLGVSSNGCNIVFDSTLDEEGQEGANEDQEENSSESKRSLDSVDVAGLTAKILSSLNGQTVHQLSLVPQLASLRYEYSQLQADGFVDKFVPVSIRMLDFCRTTKHFCFGIILSSHNIFSTRNGTPVAAKKRRKPTNLSTSRPLNGVGRPRQTWAVLQ